MAKITHFKAIIYNQEKIKDLSKVVCPPYDIISPNRQEYYHNLSPYNFIHMLLGKDIPGEDKYRRSANYFKDWLKHKILIPDERPAIYFYSQQYNLKGERKTRMGFIARLYLGDKNSPRFCAQKRGSSIFGHEHTHLESKEDRLRLLRATKANLSPIFVLFSDKKRIIQTTYQQHIQSRRPFIDIVDDERIVHKLWRLDSEDILEKIQTKMQDEGIFIADGHHRYEVACAHRDQMKQRLKSLRKDAGFNYILAYFTNTSSHGLTVLPIHRLIRLGKKSDMDSLISSIKDYFDIEEIKDKTQFFFLMEKAGQTEHVIGMYGNRVYRLLRLKNIKILDRVLGDKSPEFRSLDVSILNYIILKRILELDLENKDTVTFSVRADELIEKADSDASYIAFFLNPLKIEQIISVALSADKMPAKTTYFYPKVLSGLVINKFDV